MRSNQTIFEDFDLILSALKPSQYRAYYKEWKKNGDTLREVYDDLFGGKVRVYIRLRIDFPQYQQLYKKDIKESVKAARFSINIENYAYLYFTAIGKKEEAKAILQFQRSNFANIRDKVNDPSFFDYCPNYLLTGKYKFRTEEREISIGKILGQVKSRGLCNGRKGVSEEQLRYDITTFNQRSNEAGKDLLLVISRHPYDIAGMSTGRGWRSCMNIDDGSMRHFVMSSMMGGVLIAYLCKKKDLDLKDPLGRVLIKPYYRKSDGEMRLNPPNFILKCSKYYGTMYNQAIEKVQEWCDYNWNRFIDTEDDDYDLDTEIFYKEKYDNPIRRSKPKKS